MSSPQPQKPGAPAPIVRPLPPAAPVLRTASGLPPPSVVAAKSAIGPELPLRDHAKVLSEAVIRLAYAASLRADKDPAASQSRDTEDIVEKFNKTTSVTDRMAIICKELEKHGISKLEINSARGQLAGMTPSVPEVILRLSKAALDAHTKLNVGEERATDEHRNIINSNPDYWSIWKDGEFPKSALAF